MNMMITNLDLRRAMHGPGPSDVYPQVLEAMAQPTIGHLDPMFIEIMDDTQAFLRAVYQAEDAFTLPVSATGSGGMETLVANMTEPEDQVLVVVNGVFGGRIADCAKRFGGDVTTIDLPWGTTISPDRLKREMDNEGYKSVWVVHAETSTGALQPNMKGLGEVIHQHEALFLVDAVTSLGGIDVKLKDWDVDAAYSGTQKCLSVPPGLSPVALRPRALKKLDERDIILSWYFDLQQIRKYWDLESVKRVYHHTAPINNIYALHCGLQLLLREGLINAFQRHKENGAILQEGLLEMGFKYIVEEDSQRLPMLHAVYVPVGVNEAKLRADLMEKYQTEIGGGLGKFAGNAVRIGLMGYSCNKVKTERLVANIKKCLN
jgi:alanine-glyoxylate transaminase/serine-glyoxylate transaminase/serine-pyruvate transaminase